MYSPYVNNYMASMQALREARNKTSAVKNFIKVSRCT